MNTTSRRLQGNQAEALVCEYMTNKGFSIYSQNYSKPFGEIDIVATNQDLLLFIEVKQRTNQLYDPSYAITISKQKKIIMTAKAFIAEHTITNKICRFDVALVTYQHEKPHITYIENAFQGQD